MSVQTLNFCSFVVLGSVVGTVLLCAALPQPQSGLSLGIPNRQGFGEAVAAVKNQNNGTWGASHQFGKTVYFNKVQTSPHPGNAYRTIPYQNQQSRIPYMEGQRFGQGLSAVKNQNDRNEGTWYWYGSHQVGESVLAFSKDRFTPPNPIHGYRTITYQNHQFRITYVKVFVRNAAGQDQVYLTTSGIGEHFVKVYVGTQIPTTSFEYEATVYGFV